MRTPVQIRRALGALFVTAAAATTAAAQDTGLPIGTAAPAAAVETLDGAAANLSSVIGGGKPTLIEFWATWCGNCRELEPTLQAAQRRHGARVRFVAVAVSVNQSSERVRRYVTEHLAGFTHFYDRRGQAVTNFDVPATSYVVVLDKDGKVVYGGVGGEQDIERALASVLR
jgi:thiol-disulfide isomerase/thioredoxin